MQTLHLLPLLLLAIGGLGRTAANAQSMPDFSGEWVLASVPLPGEPSRLIVSQTGNLLTVDVPATGGAVERKEIRLVAPEPGGVADREEPADDVLSTGRWTERGLAISYRSERGGTRQETWQIVGDELRIRSSIVRMQTLGGVSLPSASRHEARYRRR